MLEQDAADTALTYGTLIDAIAPFGLAYLSYLADPRDELTLNLRARFGGTVIGNDGFGSITTREAAQAMLDEGVADLVAVGRLALANPDLAERWRRDTELNEPDQATFYGGGAEGYTDYPTLAA